MTAHLGNVPYWTACILWLGWLGFLATSAEQQPDWYFAWMVSLAGAAVIWIVRSGDLLLRRTLTRPCCEE